MIKFITANPIATFFIVLAIIGIIVWIRRNYKGANGDTNKLRNDEQERPVDYTPYINNDVVKNIQNSSGQIVYGGSSTGFDAGAGTAGANGGNGSAGARTSGVKANG